MYIISIPKYHKINRNESEIMETGNHGASISIIRQQNYSIQIRKQVLHQNFIKTLPLQTKYEIC